jgi:putative hydrolase of the HAD superfamily
MNDLVDVKVVFLDAAGTLFHLNDSVGDIYSRIAGRYGIEADPGLLNRQFAQAFRGKSAAVPGVPATPEEEKRWWHQLVSEVFTSRMSEKTFQDYFFEVFEYFRSGAAWELYGDTLEALITLKERGTSLGIISNFDSRLYDLLKDLGIARYFECVVLSWNTGVAKPDPRIFQAALAKMQISAQESLHIGDSFLEDFQGARQAGMHAILLDRPGKKPAQPGVARTLIEAVNKLNHENR